MGAGEIKIKANSVFKLSLSWGLALAELGNKIDLLCHKLFGQKLHYYNAKVHRARECKLS